MDNCKSKSSLDIMMPRRSISIDGSKGELEITSTGKFTYEFGKNQLFANNFIKIFERNLKERVYKVL